MTVIAEMRARLYKEPNHADVLRLTVEFRNGDAWVVGVHQYLQIGDLAFGYVPMIMRKLGDEIEKELKKAGGSEG